MTRRRDETIAEWIERTGARLEETMAALHYVYRAFDSYGHLLYVGCTKNTEARLATHRSKAPWFRFAETLAIAGPFDGRDVARELEMRAILTEGAYFNCTPADIKRTQANHNAAKRAMWSRGWYRPDVSDDIDPREDWEAFKAAHEAIEPEGRAWDRGLEREAARLKAGAFPYLTDEDRMQRYLAARTEQVAA